METDAQNSEAEIYGALAEDALSVFRINLVLIGIYLSVLAFTFEGAENSVVQDILGARYTFFGLSAWAGSLVSSVLFYRQSRRLSTGKGEHLDGILEKPLLTLNSVAASALASVIAAIFLATGIIEGFVGETPTLAFPAVFVGISLVMFVAIPFVFLTTVDWLSQRSKTLRGLFYPLL